MDPSNTGSYIKRRKLFKDIWDTSDIQKDNDKPTKPAIIKTVRLGDQDYISKRKKQRIKNLRTVCKKILHFCDREENDIYGRMASARNEQEIEDFFKTFKPQLESLSEMEDNVAKSPYMSSDLRIITSRSNNEYDLKISSYPFTQNKENKTTNTNYSRRNQGKNRKAICNIVCTRNSPPMPRQLYAMHTIHIPRLM